MVSPKGFALMRVRFADEPHSTRRRYLGGCHCIRCLAANSRYSTERAAAQRPGEWRGFVPATLVLDHIKKLSKGGIGYKPVAEAACIGKTTIQKIMIGRQQALQTSCRPHPGRGPSGHLKRSPSACRRTWTLLNELLEAGYTKTFLAKQLGSRARASLQIEAHRIAALTERLYRRIREGRVFR